MAAAIDITFSRRLCTQVHADVRKQFPEIDNVMRACGVTRSLRDHYTAEIVRPGVGNFVHDCRASNAWEARYKGWCALLRSVGAKGYVTGC
jgi:hypothetical protein